MNHATAINQSVIVDQLNVQYFNGRLSPEVMYCLKDLPLDNQEVCQFTERMFRLMKYSLYRPEDFSVLLGWMLGTLAPKILPTAWGGLIPPMTSEMRFERIDHYLQLNPWYPLPEKGQFLDIGCGFPPGTTVSTASILRQWEVTGIDPSFAHYIVYDCNGDYATFDDKGMLQYFQPATPAPERWNALFKDATATSKHFTGLFNRLMQLIPDDNTDGPVTVKKDNLVLLKNPVKRHENKHLSFTRAGIGEWNDHAVDIARCFNVLMYYDAAFQKECLKWITNILKPAGLFICGSDAPDNYHYKYMVYQKEDGRLVEREFAFSIDNLRSQHIQTWYVLHDDDPQMALLAEMTRIIRSDTSFIKDFDTALDRLQNEYGICPRKADGYLGGIAPGIPQNIVSRSYYDIGQCMDQLGYVEGAAKVLQKAGYKAWRNQAGHVGIAIKKRCTGQS